MASSKPPKKPKKERPNPYGFTNPYVLRALRYCQQVVAGKVNACRIVKLACQRQLDDLGKWRIDDAYDFYFDEEKASRACEFLEQLPHTQGPLAFRTDDGTWNRLVLEDWQCFTETTLYGWMRKDSPVARRTRRFTRSYEELPRGNGKSFKLSGSLLYSFTEGEQGVEAYSAAVDRAQAMKVYGEAEAMLRKRPDLMRELGLDISAHAIFQIATHSKAEAMSKEAKRSGDSKNIYFCAVDELHAHTTADVWGIIDTGTGKRQGNALVRIITTAGFNLSGICFKRRKYIIDILEGRVQDESWFGVIYTIDDTDDWTDEECRSSCTDHSHPNCVWRKANPNWGVSVDPVDFHGKMMRAVQVASERNDMLTKHLNVWCNADQAWMDLVAWDKCGDPNLTEEDFTNDPLYEALDLAWRSDICAKAKVFTRELPRAKCSKCERREHEHDNSKCEFEREEGTETHYFLFVESYLPEAAVTNSGNSQYMGWWREGRIIASPGSVLDLQMFEDSVFDDSERFELCAAGYDPAHAQSLSQNLTKRGVLMVEVRPLVLNFSPAMKDAQALVLERRLHHDANPAMRWMISNVVCHRDVKDNIYPRKDRPENKIDGPVAMIMAVRIALNPDAYGQPTGGEGSYMGRSEMVML